VLLAIFMKNETEPKAITDAITPPTYIGRRRLKWARTPPIKEPIGIIPHTKVLRVP
jgi:hypothetical protein